MRNFFILIPVLTASFLASCTGSVASSQRTATVIPKTQTPSPTGTSIPTDTPATATAPTVELLKNAMSPKEIGKLMTNEQFVLVDGVDQVPYKGWEELNSPAFLRGIINMSRQGLLSTFEDESKLVYLTQGNSVISRIDAAPLNIENEYGMGDLWSYEKSWKHQDPSSRPWRTIVFRSEFNNSIVLVPIYIFRNEDGTDGFIGLIKGNSSFSELQSDFLNPNTIRLPVGRRFLTEKGCNDYATQTGIDNEGNTFCTWNADQKPFIAEVLSRWSTTGKLDNLAVDGGGKLPIVPSGWGLPRRASY